MKFLCWHRRFQKPVPPVRRRRCCPPQVEELELRLTPAEVGLNDFRISHMGPDGNTNFEAKTSAVAYNSRANEYLVVWSGDDLTDNEFEIFGQRLNAATGAPVGDKIRISDMGPDGNTDFSAHDPAVVYNPTTNEYLVVWDGDDNIAPLVVGDFEIFGQRLTAAGAEVGANDFRISDMGPDGDGRFGAFDPAVAYNGVNNEYLVVWEGDDDTGALVNDEFEIFGQRLDGATGAEVGANDFRLSAMGPDGDINFFAVEPAVAYNGVNNQYLVVWDGTDNTAPLVEDEVEVFGQRLDGVGAAPIGGRMRLSAMGPDGDINFAAISPAVAYNGVNNEYLVVWRGDDNTGTLVGGEVEIFGQRLNAGTGAEVGANDFRISHMGPDGDPNFDAFDPAVAYNPTNNEYLVVWRGDDNTGALVDNEQEVFGQRLNAASGAEVGVNDFRLSDMGPDGDINFAAKSPAVAYNSVNNEYLVVWRGDDNTPPLVNDEFEIFGQRFSPVEPTPTPMPSPSPLRPPAQVVAVAFRQRGRARVRVKDAASGAVRGVLTPCPDFAGRLRLQLQDVNGDGSLDLIVRALVHGRRKTKIFDAVTLTPLPPGLV
jgi:hypothetical protein